MSTIKAVVFDLYGTLYDVHSVVQRCDDYYPGHGIQISAIWRQKQLEYTWLRSLMQKYVSFEQATFDALIYTLKNLKFAVDKSAVADLCDAYLNLAPHPEVPQALRRLQSANIPLSILSNGSEFSIGKVVNGSGLASCFTHLLSVERVGVFKPDPRVYALACEQLKLPASEVLFVSSNAWDIAGAGHFGFNTCWVNRNGNEPEELGASPGRIVNNIGDIADIIAL